MTNKKILTLISLLLFLFLMVGCILPHINRPPEITSEAVTEATVGEVYTYDVEATDPDPKDILTYSLTTEPSGMVIDATNGVITWTPTATGDFPVTVEVSDGDLSDSQSFTITVIAVEIELIGIKVVPDTMTLFVGKSKEIESVITAHYSDGSEVILALGDCTYLSSDEDVATVFDVGVVKAVKVGEATITVSYEGKTDTLEVTVNSILLTSIVVDPKVMTLFVTDSEDIKSVTAHYSDGSTKIVTSDCDYESSKPGIVEVEKNTGKVTAEAVAIGEATITVSYTEGEITTKAILIKETDTIEVTVIDLVHNIDANRYYNTIQAAITDAWPGDTIEVAAGTYPENLLIDRALTIKSTDGAIETIIDGSTNYMITISHSDVTFEGFTVTNPDYAGSDVSGILVDTHLGESVSNVQILDNIITQMGIPGMFGAAGINIGNAAHTLSDIVISGNTITDIKTLDDQGSSPADHTCGINIWDGASNVVISYNTISNIKYNGIILEGASNVQINDNDITSCESGVRFNPRGQDISNIQISDNDITECKYGISVVPDGFDLTGLTINYNNLFDNTEYGVLNNTDYVIDATDNWWGDASGPTHSSTTGTGDVVSDNVVFVPFSTEEN